MAKKLFELLVVEPQLKTQAQTTSAELRTSFDKKRHLFEEKKKTFTPSEEGAREIVEEQSDIQTSVASELKWITGILAKAWDTSYQVADGNTRARADVVLDNGTAILTLVPSTALLELEKRLGEFQELIKTIPTLDPAKGFTPDPARGHGIFKARDVHKTRTRKIQKALVLYPHSAEHPAQTQLISVDEPAGHLLEQEWSSLITPARKADLIERTEELRRAVKAALHRANALELSTDPPTCAEKLFKYILAD